MARPFTPDRRTTSISSRRSDSRPTWRGPGGSPTSASLSRPRRAPTRSARSCAIRACSSRARPTSWKRKSRRRPASPSSCSTRGWRRLSGRATSEPGSRASFTSRNTRSTRKQKGRRPMPAKNTKEPGEVEQAPKILDLPIGTGATGLRKESDSLGEIEVPAEHYWGAQTQRSLIHFSIGDDSMPKAVYQAYGYVKKAAALVHADDGVLAAWKAELITKVADEVISGRLDSEFPLYVWQTGSG